MSRKDSTNIFYYAALNSRKRAPRRLLLIAGTFTSIFLLSGAGYNSKAGFSKIWMNINYVSCLKNKLPCECQKATKTYFTAMLDTDHTSRSFGLALWRGDENEFTNWQLKRVSSTNFEVFTLENGAKKSLGIITLANNALTLLSQHEKVVFSSAHSDTYNENQYAIENLRLLDKAFKLRGYDPLEKILLQDSLGCDCNINPGLFNQIYTPGGKSKWWKISENRDTIYIYLITNNDGNLPDTIQTKLYKKFKWRQLE